MHIKRTGMVKILRCGENATPRQMANSHILNGSAFLLVIFTNEALIGHVFA